LVQEEQVELMQEEQQVLIQYFPQSHQRVVDQVVQVFHQETDQPEEVVVVGRKMEQEEPEQQTQYRVIMAVLVWPHLRTLAVAVVEQGLLE
tara:strand:+ start:729 stop:1001 length:273 start_codon:yes stop_codon:yes gene_type:complete